MAVHTLVGQLIYWHLEDSLFTVAVVEELVVWGQPTDPVLGCKMWKDVQRLSGKGFKPEDMYLPLRVPLGNLVKRVPSTMWFSLCCLISSRISGVICSRSSLQQNRRSNDKLRYCATNNKLHDRLVTLCHKLYNNLHSVTNYTLTNYTLHDKLHYMTKYTLYGFGLGFPLLLVSAFSLPDVGDLSVGQVL